MLEHLRAPFKKLIEPIAKALIAIGLSANAVTVIGAIGTIVVAIATGITGWLFGGAVVLTLLVLADSLDGSIAMLTTGGTEFGAFLDSTLDRIADWAMLVGVILFFVLHDDWWHTGSDGVPDYVGMIGVVAAAVAVMTSFVTSYARARAESVGYEVRKRRGHACGSSGDHSGGHGRHRVDPTGGVADHSHGAAGRIGTGHRASADIRSPSADVRR